MRKNFGLNILDAQFFNLKSKTCPEPCRRIQSRKSVGTVAVVVTLTMCGAVAQAATGKVPKIGFLGARSAASGTGLERLRQELRALGYVEGKNIVFESRYADNQLDRLPAIADELVRIKVDALVAADTPEALAAKNATKTIPIVFVIGGDPVTAGLVDSLARPGRNITGFTISATVLAGKRLELLKEIIPKLSRVVVLWDPQDRGSTQQWKESQPAAKELGLQIHSIQVSSANDLESAFKEATKAGNTALAVTQSPLLGQKRIADLATENRLPAIYDTRNLVDSGGLMSYGVDRTEPYRRVASMIDKILKGTKPADLPVEQATKFELVINLKSAKQIGLTIPPNVLARADKVIK
jgi:putative tryptophan/tyrosine transport system substrate-binding protein